jgi:hypothetical protein
LRIVEERQQDDVVVFLDLERHFAEVVRDSAALQRISTWDVSSSAAPGISARLN